METSKPTLRPFLEAIENQCQSLDRESLIQLILTIAKQVDAEKRNDFRQIFTTTLPETVKHQADLPKVSTLLAEIKDLRRDIEARIESIDDGSYWDDPDDDEDLDSYYHSQDPDNISDDQEEELDEFFNTADQFFIQGDREKAEKIYAALFSLLDEISDTYFSNMKETRARHARCVYELSSPEERIENMLATVGGVTLQDACSEFSSGELPLLEDIINAETGELADFDSFLALWNIALKKLNFRQRRVANLLIEATILQDGLTAVGQLACDWGRDQPLGFLFWLKQLEQKEDWPELRNVANTALSALANNAERQEVAEYLIMAGKKLGEDITILDGYRERFNSQPDNTCLLNLVAESSKQQVRELELEKVHNFLSKSDKTIYGADELQVKSLLMAGKIETAFELCKQNKEVGWSFNGSTGLLYGAILYMLSDANKSCTLIKRLLKNFADNNIISFASHHSNPPEPKNTAYAEIAAGLNMVSPASSELKHYQQWVFKIGKSRVDNIVSNTNRNAYARAALTLGSLAETMAASGETDKAHALLHDYCRVRYNRHVAFRKEVRSAVAHSQILAGFGDGL